VNPAAAAPAKAATFAPAPLVKPAAAAPRGAVAEATSTPAPVSDPHPLHSIEDEEEQTVIASASALAGVFSQTLSTAERPSREPPAPGADEWYVGINGVPVGPIRLTELRSKAASGGVTKDSLVWRDGFEDWKPLSTYPELVAVIEETLSSARASLAPLPPPTPAAGIPAAGAAGQAKPTTVAAAAVLDDPFAARPAATASPAVRSVTGSAVVTESLDIDGAARRRRGSPYAAWIAVVVALMFGLTIGFVVFNRGPEVKYVQVPVAQPVAQAPAQPAAQPVAAEQAIEETSVSAGAKTGKGGVARPKNEAPPAETKGGGLSGLSGLSGLQAGPQQGPAIGGGQSPGGGQGLDGGTIQKTVSRYTGSVKRRCWQPALDTRSKDAPTSARVSATITVGPSGAVQNVTTSGDPNGYRGLAPCIAGSIRGWQFPASGGTTTVNVPFVFAAQ
jgi:hypothetical protein